MNPGTDMKIDLEQLLNTKVDLVSSNGVSKYIKPLIDHEKKLINVNLGIFFCPGSWNSHNSVFPVKLRT
jgi:hypothetical protein